MSVQSRSLAACAALLAAALVVLAAPAPAEAQNFAYSVKYVCGFNRNNVGFDNFGFAIGEATVKAGNYATDINIMNFDPAIPANVTKRLLVLYDALKPIPPVGREPNVVGPIGGEAIFLPQLNATMDDCNKLYQLAGIALMNPPPLLIGYLWVISNRPLDITAVYTAEICTDWTFVGPDFMCSNANSGGGLSIHVEQIRERRLP
jgi:hypothetical protein